MARPTCKEELMRASCQNYSKMLELIDGLSDNERNAEFDFSLDDKKTEAHWRRDKNLRDVLVHLYEWQRLLVNFVVNNRKGCAVPFLPNPYTWKTYGDMNVEIWKRYQPTTYESARALLQKSHDEVMALADEFTDEELFQKMRYKWTGSTSLGSYFISTTSSHYDWAIKKIKAHVKNCKKA